MEIIWLAIVIYSVGLAAILYTRPALMFNANGTWKEFGYKRDSRYTIFPFWLFSITWAIVAYALAASIKWALLPGVALASYRGHSIFSSDDESEEEEEEFVQPEVKAKPRPGYYVLDNKPRKNGVRKYVYYGTEAPPA